MAQHTYLLEDVKASMRARLRDDYDQFVRDRLQEQHDDFMKKIQSDYDDFMKKLHDDAESEASTHNESAWLSLQEQHDNEIDKYKEDMHNAVTTYKEEMHSNLDKMLGHGSDTLHDLLGKDESEWDNLNVGNRCAKLLLFKNPNLLEQHKHFVRPRILHIAELLEPMQIRDAVKCQMLTAREGQGLSMSVYFYGAIRSNADSCRHVANCFEHNIKNGNQYLACVVNTSTKLDVGGHWIMVGVDNVKKVVEYWDPMGREPKKDDPLLTRIFALKVFDDYDLIVSHTRHQRGGTECGVYCIYYLCSRVILGKSMREINATPVDDRDMQRYWRTQFFR